MVKLNPIVAGKAAEEVDEKVVAPLGFKRGRPGAAVKEAKENTPNKRVKIPPEGSILRPSTMAKTPSNANKGNYRNDSKLFSEDSSDKFFYRT